jgi:hypothetical protein
VDTLEPDETITMSFAEWRQGPAFPDRCWRAPFMPYSIYETRCAGANLRGISMNRRDLLSKVGAAGVLMASAVPRSRPMEHSPDCSNTNTERPVPAR